MATKTVKSLSQHGLKNTRSPKSKRVKSSSSKNSKKKITNTSQKKVTPKTKKAAKSPIKQEKKKAHKSKGKCYSLIGELVVTTSETPSIVSGSKTVKTPEIVVDPKGNMFTKTSLDIEINGKRGIVVLDAEQAELVLKTLRIAEYA